MYKYTELKRIYPYISKHWKYLTMLESLTLHPARQASAYVTESDPQTGENLFVEQLQLVLHGDCRARFVEGI